jgi:hypothetical protein
MRAVLAIVTVLGCAAGLTACKASSSELGADASHNSWTQRTGRQQ